MTATIAGVTLDGVDAAILHNTNMVGRTILAAIIPIEKDNAARARFIRECDCDDLAVTSADVAENL